MKECPATKLFETTTTVHDFFGGGTGGTDPPLGQVSGSGLFPPETHLNWKKFLNCHLKMPKNMYDYY